MSDANLDWKNDRPTQDPGPFESEAWNTDNMGNAAYETIDGVKPAVDGYNAASDMVSDVQDIDVETLTDWDSVTGLVGDMNDNISTIADSASEFTDVVSEIGANPVEWLAGTIVDFLMEAFQPLEDLVQMVTGNEERMLTSADMWSTVADGCGQVGQYVAESGLNPIQEWEGAAASAAKTRIDEASQAVSNMGFVATGLNYLLQLMSKVAKSLYETVLDLIKQGVQWVLERIVPYIAASFATFGAASAVAVGDTIRKVAQLVMTAWDWIKKAMNIFEQAMQAIEIVQSIIEKVRPIIDFLMNAKAAYDGAMEVWDSKDDIIEGVQTVADGVSDIASGNVDEGVSDILGGTRQTAQGANQAASGASDSINAVNDATGGDNEYLNQAADYADSTADFADTVDSRAESAEGVQDAVNETIDNAGNVYDGVQSAMDGNVQEGVNQAMDGASDTLSSTSDGLENANDTLGGDNETLQNAQDGVDGAQESVDNARENMGR
ncbi:hypothetical protein [Haloglycomyces albus]|uniref:hypothetical protein n=1 Tax=Haloglycomyces albus TaxID=526067 RepID=UPI00046CE40A|nr:hypothetical protein [Haloglycomyces albus]